MEALPYFLVPKGSSADGDEHVLKIKYYYFKVKRNIVFTFFRSWGGSLGVTLLLQESKSGHFFSVISLVSSYFSQDLITVCRETLKSRMGLSFHL